MKNRTDGKKKLEAAEKQFAGLRGKITDQLPKLPMNPEKRKKKRKEMISGLWRSTDCEMLADFLFETDRKDDELAFLSKSADIPDLFEGIRREIRVLKSQYRKKPTCYDVEMDAYTKVYATAAAKMKEAGKEDLEILMEVIAKNVDDRRFL